MNLSADQVRTFWSMWAKACRVQKWTRAAGLSAGEIDARRKALLARCGFASLTKVDRVNGFTKVKSELMLLISDNTDMAAAEEANDPLLNKARNFRHVIRAELLPCLALYEENAAGYLQSVLADKSRWWKLDRPERGPTLEDFDARPILTTRNGEPHESPSQLEQLMMTLNARLHEKRKAARHSLHDMRTSAGIKCGCRECGLRRVFVTGPMVPALPQAAEPEPVSTDDPDWKV